jgi:hypothetical protein
MALLIVLIVLAGSPVMPLVFFLVVLAVVTVCGVVGEWGWGECDFGKNII